MKTNYLSQTESLKLEEKFFEEAKQIQAMQDEINNIQDQLDKAFETTEMKEYSFGKAVDFERILLLKQISEELEPKRERLRESIINLYHSLFPGDIFISQNFYDVWISIKPNWVVRFAIDLESIELKLKDELN
ncbi:MAG: hypothetical protein IPP15_16295 [Saprospiraceae bacterium]|uniref:Uncharacterized protein n=1 Tax=Candidatus Opimibacter skivensis TaxID=2982028 RepID=A0A9D7SYA5_9BACT|nr:hypothetical protein [Candidatus Opimibacter skivensis]